MKLRALRCLFVVACITVAVTGCGSSTSSPPTTVKAIAAGDGYSVAIKSDGSLWTWGRDKGGQILLGKNAENTATPARFGTAGDWASVACRSASSFALKTDGSLWGWGGSAFMAFLPPEHGKANGPTRFGDAHDWAAIACGGTEDSGETFCLALKKDGSLWAWGSNSGGGGIGLGEEKSTTTPTRVGAANDWAAIACGDDFSLALKTDGTLWAWGDNSSGQLGIGNTSTPAGAGEMEFPVSTPTRVGKANDWAAVAGGQYFSLALKTDGSLWAWGDNKFGELGRGGTASTVYRPARVGKASDWSAIACGEGFSLALKKDGGLWEWGEMWSGYLRPGYVPAAIYHRHTPFRVGAAHDWASIACGSDHCLAVKKDGTLWAWGFNDDGQLGLGVTGYRLAPTLVTDWSP